MRSAAAEHPARQHRRIAGPLILVLCLLVAISMVLFIPLFVGGASSSPSSLEAPASSQLQTVQSYQNPEEALAALGYEPALPSELPTGYRMQAARVLEGNVLELEYGAGQAQILYRTALGNDDLSDGQADDYTFAVTEDTSGTARTYCGQDENSFQLTIWADDEMSYAIISSQGIASNEMRVMAESI